MKIEIRRSRLLRVPGFFAVAAMAGCAFTQPAPAPVPPPPPPVVVAPAPEPEPPALAPDAPALPREFRGVWVATVRNMDWPSRRGLSTGQQQAELIAIMDRAKQLGLNAIIFQVRPSGDALYASPIEPWSEYLTGQMGRAPDPYYDPLEFAVREAHRRGLELHAWFNPFRAADPGVRSAPTADHISRARPDLVRRYGGHLWMDPSEPEVQDQGVRVVLDVVRRYDIDGVHIDDYFYPYREYERDGDLIQFPDDVNYQRYRREGGTLGRSDWRRENVNRFVQRLYGEVKGEKARVKVGISPFGIWRPGYPAQIRGLDAYEEIFADARKWLHNGWLDYFTPQLYWPIAQTPQSFPVLLDWWVEQNLTGRHIWPGSYSDRVGTGRTSWPAREIQDQVEVTRARAGSTGNVFFRMTSLMEGHAGLGDALGATTYAAPALVPPSPWLDRTAPDRPELSISLRTPLETSVAMTPVGDEEVFLWAVRSRQAGLWKTLILPGASRTATIAGTPDQVAVNAIGRSGNESPAAVVEPWGVVQE